MKKIAKKMMIVLIATLVSLALHSLIPVTVPITEDKLTFIANKLTFLGTVTLFFIVAYYLIGVVFLKYESKLNGGKLGRAIVFGSLVGGIWLVGMIEAVFVFGTDFYGEFLTGLFDFVPIVLLCFLLAVFLVEEKGEAVAKQFDGRKALIAISIFLLVFTAGRGLRYLANITSYSSENMVLLMIWTVAFALIISLNFVYFKTALTSSSIIKQALQFTLILFGVHYFMFVYFMPLIFKGMLMELTIVYIYDLLLVFIASVLALRRQEVKKLT